MVVVKLKCRREKNISPLKYSFPCRDETIKWKVVKNTNIDNKVLNTFSCVYNFPFVNLKNINTTDIKLIANRLYINNFVHSVESLNTFAKGCIMKKNKSSEII
jgi:hypothetical protein